MEIEDQERYRYRSPQKTAKRALLKNSNHVYFHNRNATDVHLPTHSHQSRTLDFESSYQKKITIKNQLAVSFSNSNLAHGTRKQNQFKRNRPCTSVEIANRQYPSHPPHSNGFGTTPCWNSMDNCYIERRLSSG